MSYSANQYNYATPLSSSKLLTRGTVKGVQMLGFDAWLANIESVGVTRGTYTADNIEKTISITATENDAFTPYFAYNALLIPAKPNTKYTLSFNRSGAPGRVFLFDSGDTANMVQSDANVTYAALTLTTSATTTFITLRVGASTADTTATFSEIMLNEGESALPYEEFNYGLAYPRDIKYFTLFDNVLDGSYVPVVGDVGLWGSSVSDTNGNLSEPFIITVTDSVSINSISYTFSQDCYAVDFTIKLFNGDEEVYSNSVTNNNSAAYVCILPEEMSITSYRISITKISKSNAVAKLYSVNNPNYVVSTDSLKVKSVETTSIELSDGLKLLQRVDTLRVVSSESSRVRNNLRRSDTAKIKCSESNRITNIIDVIKERIALKANEDISHVTNIIEDSKDTLVVTTKDVSIPTNVHTRMKDITRRTYGKVEVTYTDPMLDREISIESTPVAYNSGTDQLFDDVHETVPNLFMLYENDLTGSYVLSDENTQVGWVSANLSGAGGVFDTPVGFTISFFSRPIISFNISFDDSRNNLVKDFKIIFTKTDGTEVELDYSNNSEKSVAINANLPDVVSIQLLVIKVEREGIPAVVLDMSMFSSILYKGYEDESKLMSIDLLEELSYEDEIEMLGGVSANEITVVLDNSNRDFFFNSGSLIANQLKRNRKIVPWLGTEIIPGQIEWHPLGTFWSYKWDVPKAGLTATVVGFDTIGLLGNTPFTEHHVQVNKSLGELIQYVLDDAKKQLSFIEYVIDDSLYDVVIPYAWFDNSSHAAALRKISLCYPMHIYCDRQGRICASSQKLHLDYYLDTWSEATNIIDTNYSSLYTALPNIINVTVHNPVVLYDEKLAESNTPFTVADMESNVLNFSKPYLSDIVVDIDCDSTVSYNYEVYSWGIIIAFSGAGTIRSILCTGSCIDASSSSVISKRDEERIMLDGAIKRDVNSQLIQTFSLAKTILNRFFEIIETDKYDATVEYRGDIALSINDPIVLKESIAPDNRYNIKRHQLSWNGALTGSADLNT